MTFETATTLSSPTGAELRLYIQRPPGAVRGVVQVNHGLTEHAGRYARFARFLAEKGFATYAQDHRGHGHTRAPGAPLGAFGPEPAANRVIDDVEAVHRRIAADHPGLPVILFGHSMGAMIALVTLKRWRTPVQAAAIWNAPIGPYLLARAAKAVLAWERFRLGSDVPSRIIPRLTFDAWGKAIPDARTAYDWLSRDQEVVDDFLADPLCGFDPTVGMWQAVFDFNLEIVRGDFSAVPKDLPIQLVSGKADPSTRGGKTMAALKARLRGQGFSNLTTNVYPETRHETHGEVNRDRVMEDFARWADSVTARRE